MVDPITLSALGAVVITEGIKFFYGQAGEVLKRWRERKSSASKNAAPLPETEAVQITLPPIFEGQLSSPQIHFNVLERVEEQLRELRKDLSDYADGIETVDTTDEPLLQRINALRLLLEAIYQQHFTFSGEQRPASGPVVRGSIDVGEIAGYASAVRARVIASGEVTAEVKARRVEAEGALIGIEADTIGENSFFRRKSSYEGEPPS
jgi:hypothetical protein